MTFTLVDVPVLELPLIRDSGVPIVSCPPGVRDFLLAVCRGVGTLGGLIFFSVLSEHLLDLKMKTLQLELGFGPICLCSCNCKDAFHVLELLLAQKF